MAPFIGGGVKWRRFNIFQGTQVFLSSFSLPSLSFMPAGTSDIQVPPPPSSSSSSSSSRDLHAWMSPGKRRCAAGWYGQRGGVLVFKVGSDKGKGSCCLLGCHRDRAHGEEWMPSWLWQASKCGSEVMIPLSAAEGKAEPETQYAESIVPWRRVCVQNRQASEEKLASLKRSCRGFKPATHLISDLVF